MSITYPEAALDVVGAAVIFVAVVRVVTTPAERWPHGRLSKTAWVVAAVYFAPVISGVMWPLAAALAIWRTRQITRTARAATPADLPFATGSPEQPVAGREHDGSGEES